jgi:hypothetical protein
MADPKDPAATGPIDVAVIGFTGDTFNGEIAPALLDLVEQGIVSIIDLVFVRKDADGVTSWIEVGESDDVGPFAALVQEQFDLLSDDDLDTIAQELDPGSAAMIVVWENLWLSNLAGAILDNGGFLISQDRIPVEVVALALAALQDD